MCRLLAVHPARPDLIAMYGRYGFTLIEATPALMVLTMARIRATLAALGG